jgi:hypothetical protein
MVYDHSIQLFPTKKHLKKVISSNTLSVLPPRIELGLTVPKTAVISVSLQEHAFIYTEKKPFCQRKINLTLDKKTDFRYYLPLPV